MNKIVVIWCLFFGISTGLAANGVKDPIVIKGFVGDLKNGGSIADAEISIEINGQLIHAVKSDKSGNFLLRYEGTFSRTDKVKVVVFKRGYKIRSFQTLHTQTEEFIVMLEKKPQMKPVISPGNSTKPQSEI